MSYNSLFGLGSHSEDANLEGWWPCTDDAANTTVDDQSTNNRDGTLNGGNTSAKTAGGPNNWLTKSLEFDGNDYIDFGDLAGFEPTSDVTLAARVYSTISEQGAFATILAKEYSTPRGTPWVSHKLSGHGGAPDNKFHMEISSSNTQYDVPSTTTPTQNTWQRLVGTYDDVNIRLYVNGSSEGTTALTGDIDYSNGALLSGANEDGAENWQGRVSDLAIFSRALSSSEVGELDDGPEPVNSVAPAITGTTIVGQILTSSTGTWALPSPFASGTNGTVTYTYQWTRSDDASGTNEANISGATSSSYTLVSDDLGKYIGVKVLASNDGGSDSSAETTSARVGAVTGDDVNNVLEYTSTSGTGTVTLVNSNKSTFSAVVGAGNKCHYRIVDPVTGEFEHGKGTLATASTLQRDKVYRSSNAGAKVDFASNVKLVTVASLLNQIKWFPFEHGHLNDFIGNVSLTPKSYTTGQEIEVGRLALVNINSADVTLDLPAKAQPRDRVGVLITDQSLAYDLTLQPNGLNFQGTTNNQTFSTENQYVEFEYINTSFGWAKLTTAEGSSASGAYPKGYKYGLTISNGTDTAHDIDVAVGVARSEQDSENMNLVTAITKQIDATWAAGDDAGGLFTGTVANSTWYHVFLIKKDSDGSIDAGFDTSFTAANIPTGYTAYRRIGSVLTDGSANILQFSQKQDMFLWLDPPQDFSSTTVGTTAQNVTLSVPPDLVVRPILQATVWNATADKYLYIYCPDVNDEAPAYSTAPSFNASGKGSAGGHTAQFASNNVMSNTSKQVRIVASGSDSTVYIVTRGWRDFF